MGAGGAAGLLLVMLLLMPGTRSEDCRQGEYWHEGHCCLFCPAGTYVAKHCSAPHSRGTCDPCVEGETYTAHENGLEECLPCRQCKDDQVSLRTCTLTHDTECQCKQGYFCPAEACEICQRCTTTCPDGKEIVWSCNATVDLGCGFPGQESTAFVWIVTVSVVVCVWLLFCVIMKLKNNKAASTTDKDLEKGLKSEGSTETLMLPEVEMPANKLATSEGENSGEGLGEQVQTKEEDTPVEENSIALAERGTILGKVWRCWRRIAEPSLLGKAAPSPTSHQHTSPNFWGVMVPGKRRVQKQRYQVIVKDLSQKELSDSFGAFINGVPWKKWKRLMRTHLSENDIAKVIGDFPNDKQEQSYQMLLIWKNTLGEKQCIIRLLEMLRDIDTKAYDNVLNTLKSSNIINLEVTD